MSATGQSMSIEVENGIVVVRFADDALDVAAIPPIQEELEQAIRRTPRPKIVIDLSSFRYVPTTALGMLVAILTKVLRKDGQLRLCGLNERVTGLLAIARLDTIFEIHETLDSALRSFR